MPVCGHHHESIASSRAASVTAPTARAVALRLTTRVAFHQRVPEGGGRRWSDVYSRPQTTKWLRTHTHNIAVDEYFAAIPMPSGVS